MADINPGVSDVPSPFTTTRNLRERVVSAVLAQAGFNHAGLNENLRQRLGSNEVSSGGLVSEPVIEGAAAYQVATKMLSEMRGSILAPATVDALTSGVAGDEYRFDPFMRPYTHQFEAWQHLLQPNPRSILVTSGTGSGKTECFLVPLLDDLVRESETTGERLSGVRAIMLYPLNALIASQKKRLQRWTIPFDGRVRFGLYNGMTPEDLRDHDRRVEAQRHPEEVTDRKTIRSDPPPILVTNVTMLEYLTIRREDRSLLRNSDGKLRWIIIDEAHSYVGSAAAEIALLLRRVLQAFNVKAHDVRFVATSATIGGKGEESHLALRRFLADLAGVAESQVYVVEGLRAPIDLEKPVANPLIASLADRNAITRNPHVQSFVRAVERGPISLLAACRLLAPAGQEPIATMEAIADDQTNEPLIPLRIHQFMRAVPGLWTCLNHECSGEKPFQWPFGALAFERADYCGHCHSPLFEVSACRDCGEPYLEAYDQRVKLTALATPPDIDEFAAASEREDETSDEVGGDAESEKTSTFKGPGHRRLLATRSIQGMTTIAVDMSTGVLPDRRDIGTAVAITRLSWACECPACHATQRNGEQSPIRPFRFGAPFLIGNAVPVMLEGIAPMEQTDGILPAGGRRLLSFTDSRQGTARFAASIETNSERAYVRGYIYHAIQKSSIANPERLAFLDKLRKDIDILEVAVKATPALESIIQDKRVELGRELSSSSAGVPWSDMRLKLSQDPIIQHWIRAVWQDRDPRFRNDTVGFASFLLLRELARRPRRANSLETLGLAQLRFDRIEKLSVSALPQALRVRGCMIEEWRDFLYLLIDGPVRSSFALDVSADDVRWLLPRGGVRRNIVGPGQTKRSKNDLSWPQARPGSVKPNAVLWLQHCFGFDPESSEDRSQINDILDASWNALSSLFDNVGSEYALDFNKAIIAPVTRAWLCPVTRRVISHRLFNRSPYGHRESSPFADIEPISISFPMLPLPFPRNNSDHLALVNWVRTDSLIASLRVAGVWNNLHDRAAQFAPYMRAEEHSAQQPPDRLRVFEGEFSRGEINLLACSTTMEMGVDIGSVSAVLMTNVPPSIANYRQRVGRAGRRRQGFASSLTLARDTPLDRETFRQPESYLARQLRPPQVTLDAPRIIQRHINALLLSKWFAEAKGELLKLKTGPFFGYSEKLDFMRPDRAPIDDFCSWLEDPSVRDRIGTPILSLVRGTVLEGNQFLSTKTREMFVSAHKSFEQQWSALRSEAKAAPSDQARTSIILQLKRLCRESLLKELANRALLPGHGFPTSVVPFINDSRESRARVSNDLGDANESSPLRRYDYPSRNADIAIREYAPGAEVVIDGLVWRSAGVTLNWQRPAHEEAAREIQSLRHFWQCRECGAADCGQLRVEGCPVCGSSQIEVRRFLEPAGFRVDWDAPCHADTDQVAFIEPEPPRISARGADWEPLLDPILGRGRTTPDGLVFFAAAGTRRCGYRICLECGRAEEERDGLNPLAEHTPLRGARPGDDRLCPGGTRAFSMTEPVALGYEILTDVAEFQPVDLLDIGGAWALVSALREALARRMGIQASELGMGVEPRRGTLAEKTHSLFLYDRNSGGAGFATRLLDEPALLIDEVYRILSCDVPGCERGCAACVLTADLFAQQEIVDRRAALVCVGNLIRGMCLPQTDDAALPKARLSRPVADMIVRNMLRGDRVTIFAREAFNLTVFFQEPFVSLFAATRTRGVELQLGIQRTLIEELDAAQRLGLRDAAVRHGFSLWHADPPTAPNSAMLVAILESSSATTAWFSRDNDASIVARGWGIGQTAPVVYGVLTNGVEISPIELSSLLPKASTAVKVISADKGRSLRLFGDWFAKLLRDELEPLGLWQPGMLGDICYSDRYLRSPLNILVTVRALAGIRDSLVGKGSSISTKLVTSPLDTRKSQMPFLLFHDWQNEVDRDAVTTRLAQTFNIELTMTIGGAQHARELLLRYKNGVQARLYLDQGFGYWQISNREKFDFAASPTRQAKVLEEAGPMIFGNGNTYLAIVG